MKHFVLKLIVLFATLFQPPSLALATEVEKSRIKLEPVVNTKDVGELPAEGTVVVTRGGDIIIYGLRGRCGDLQAPAFVDVIKNMATPPDGLGEFYDAGAGFRNSGRCGGKVVARAVGLRLYPTFTGEAKVTFYRLDHVIVRVSESDPK